MLHRKRRHQDFFSYKNRESYSSEELCELFAMFFKDVCVADDFYETNFNLRGISENLSQGSISSLSSDVNKGGGPPYRRSAKTNTTEFTNFAVNTVESGSKLDVAYLDFQKAFDRISHTLFIKKLGQMEVHSSQLDWMNSYLTQRSQYDKIEQQRSS